jgi:hypothetical protein
MIVRPTSHITGGFSPNTVQLIPSPNTANLNKIVFNMHLPILLRLLLCKEQRLTPSPDNCPYPEHKNDGVVKKTCGNSVDKMAQIYVRHEKMDTKARSCVLVFIEGHYLSNIDNLFLIVKNTVDWLQIAHEKPYFYIFHYGSPVFGTAATHAIKKLNKKIKELFTEYSQTEDICMGSPVGRRSESLQINHTVKFSFTTA